MTCCRRTQVFWAVSAAARVHGVWKCRNQTSSFFRVYYTPLPRTKRRHAIAAWTGFDRFFENFFVQQRIRVMRYTRPTRAVTIKHDPPTRLLTLLLSTVHTHEHKLAEKNRVCTKSTALHDHPGVHYNSPQHFRRVHFSWSNNLLPKL